MRTLQARAEVEPVRQRTQFTCMATSMMMCLRAQGIKCDEDEVAEVMGCRPMKGASWEDALACAQHYGMRATLTSPCTVGQLKEWTDAGTPVMIAWNPEGRPWSHASVVFDVDEEGNVHVADPNIPNPTETTRVVPESEFYGKWAEKWPNYLVRRPAMAIEREITPEGRQVVASTDVNWERISSGYRYIEEGVLIAFISRGKQPEKYKEKNVPSWADITNDGEMFADISTPEEAEEQGQMWDEHQQALRQGWYWATRMVPAWQLTLMHLQANKAFEAWFKTEAEALKKGTEAVKKMRNRVRPRWMEPLDLTKTRGWSYKRSGDGAVFTVKGEFDFWEGSSDHAYGDEPEEYGPEGDDYEREALGIRQGGDPVRAEHRPVRKTAREIYVDDQGYAHDDEGNSWFVGKKYGPRTYLGPEGDFLSRMAPREPAYQRRRAPKSVITLTNEDKKYRDRLRMALFAAGADYKTKKFVSDISWKSELTDKQYKWFKSIVRKHKSFMDRMPAKLNVSYTQHGVPWYVYVKDPQVEKWVTDNYDTRPFYKAPDSLELVGPKTSKAPAAPATQTGISYTPAHTEALEALLAGAPGNQFIKGMLALVKSGRPLTDKQLSAIRRQFYQARMRDKADLFRPPKTASAARVASRYLGRLSR